MAKDPPPVAQPPPLAAPHRLIRAQLGLTCFVAGAAIMVIEISANRLLAPNFGNSLYTWTALIGVILVAFSVGGYLGGALADKFGRLDLLAWLLAGASALTMLIPVLNSAITSDFAEENLGGLRTGLITGPMLASIILFALPGILLGAVAPASVRFYSLAGHDEHVGRAAGTISMLGSLGSFVGTFLSGFVLLSNFGVRFIFVTTGTLLLLLAVLAFLLARKTAKIQAGVAGTVLLCAGLSVAMESKALPSILYTQNSFYHQIEVSEHDGGASRYLRLDSTMEGGMTWPAGELVMTYQQFWSLALLNENLKVQRALFIGAGAFGMPEQVARLGPAVQVDVVELDPAVIEVGRRFFKLNEFPNIHAHANDARRFLLRWDPSTKYDLIFGDAYNGVRHIPAHLVTREFFAQVKARLTEDGIFLMNVITAVQGEHAELLAHILSTLRAVFPDVEVFAVGTSLQESQNVILLCSMKSWKPWLEEKLYTTQSWQGQLAGARVPPRYQPPPREVFTDDWNPVDAVIARQLK